MKHNLKKKYIITIKDKKFTVDVNEQGEFIIPPQLQSKTSIKPAWEVILVFRKPLEETVADNVLTHGTGGLNIDGCRIGGGETLSGGSGKLWSHYRDDTEDKAEPQINEGKGRWPANLILSHHPDCRPLGVKKVKNRSGDVTGNEPSSPIKNTYSEYNRKEWSAHGDEHGLESVEKWDCVNGCPVKEMDSQSGNRPGCTSPSDAKPESKYRPGQGNYQPQGPIYGDKGGASRFFLNTPTFRYVSKASRKERELGCDHLEHHSAGEVTGGRKEGSAGLDNPRAGAGRVQGAKNIHPTVKPLDIMRWLVRLVTPPDGIVLDPFAGSGSTAMAAILEGFQYVGIEKDEGYFEIAKSRVQFIEDGGLVEKKSKKKKEPKSKKQKSDLKINFYSDMK